MIRLLLGLLFSLISFGAFAAPNALIFISHDEAGPNLPTSDYFYSDWIRWPEETFPRRGNRMLSLLTGMDWQGEPGDVSFRSEDGGFRNLNAKSLSLRGYFEARERFLDGQRVTVVAGASGQVSPNALFLGLAGPDDLLFPSLIARPLPTDGLIVFEASKWTDATDLARRIAPGRTMVIEYPPAPGQEGWSRYFLFGDWPKGKVPVETAIRVPGLIPARDLVRLLTKRSAFIWQRESAGVWGGANRWLEHGQVTGAAVLIGWFCLGAAALLVAFAQVMNEDRGPFTSNLLVQLALSPAVIVAAGALARHGGLEAWPIWLAVSWLFLAAATAALSYLNRAYPREHHPLWPVCIVGAVTLALFDPLWSDLSNRFVSVDRSVPDAATGAFIGYLAGVSAFSLNRWPGRIIALALLLWGLTARPWWVDGHPELLVLPGILWAANEGLLRWPVLIVLALLPTTLIRIWQGGFAWTPGGEVVDAFDVSAFDLSRYVSFLGSPVFLFSLLTVGLVVLFGNRFLIYRIRKILRGDPRLRVLAWAALATLALGIAEPTALGAGLIIAFGAAIAIAFDGLRANA